MKRFLPLLVMLVSFNAFAATQTIVWSKPVPAFNGYVDPTWTIDEYRLSCTSVRDGVSVPITKTIIGYDTETTTIDAPAGLLTCTMVSYSVATGTESVPTPPASKEVYDTGEPNSPLSLDVL